MMSIEYALFSLADHCDVVTNIRKYLLGTIVSDYQNAKYLYKVRNDGDKINPVHQCFQERYLIWTTEKPP